MRILSNAACIDAFNLRHQESLEKNLKAIGLSPQANDLRAEVSSRLHTMDVLLTLGKREEAYLHATAFLDAAERLHNRPLMINTFAGNQMLAQLEGDWSTARAFSDRSLEMGSQELSPLALRALLEYESGDLGQGEAYLDQLTAVGNPFLLVLPVAVRFGNVIDSCSIVRTPRTVLGYAAGSRH